MKYFKKNNGISLIKLILVILFTILLVFLAYEIFYVDVFDLKNGKLTNTVDSFKNWTQNLIENIQEENKEVEITDPNLNENQEIVIPNIEGNDNQNIEQNIYTKHYYYRQLDEYAKIIYKGLESNQDNMKSGNYKIDFGKQFNDLLNSEKGEEKLNIAFQSAWNAYTYDYPEIFYIDVTKLTLTTQTTSIGSFSTHKVDLSSGDNANYFSKDITSAEEAKKRIKYVSDIKTQFISQLENSSEYEKIKLVHDWLVDNLEYDTSYSFENTHNVYGAFSNKKVVCEAYARTFKYILDGVGIENVLISGEATNSSGTTESHAWNYVKLDNKWYAVDVTWDDPVIEGSGKLTKKVKYMYFLKGADQFFENHEEDGVLSKNSIEFKFPILEKENYQK